MPPAIIEIQDPLRSATRPYRHPERDVEGAVPYEGIGYDLSVFNHPEGIPSCAMAQFMVKPIHARKGNSLAIGRRPTGIVNRGGGRCGIL